MENYKVSLGQNKYDQKPIDMTLSQSELVDLLCAEPRELQSKGEGKYLVSGHFGGQKRLTANLSGKSLLNLDIDYCQSTLEQLINNLTLWLGEYAYVVYTTGSHTPEKPRVRVVMFLSAELSTKAYRVFADQFVKQLPIELQELLDTNSTLTPNNAMFLAVKPNKDYRFYSQYIEGNELQVAGISEESDSFNPHWVNKVHPMGLSASDIKSYLDKIDPSSLDYMEWVKVGMAIHHETSASKDGYQLWLTWSKLDKRYKAGQVTKDCKAKWASFTLDSGSVTTFNTVASMVNNQMPCLNHQQGEKKKNVSELKKTETLVPVGQWYQVRGKNLTPIMCIENLKALLAYYDIKVGYDVILKQPRITFEGKRERDLNSATTKIKSLCVRNNMNTMLVSDYVASISAENSMNPWKDWITSKKWDGVDRVQSFCDTITVKEGFEESKNMYLRRWLDQLIHVTCLNDHDKAKMARSVLVFQGNQRVGKTTWFNHLVPENKSMFIQSGATLSVGNDMSVLACVRHAIVELGELDATFRKSDLEQLKSFISNTKDILNIKYQKHHMEARRRTVFFGSVNDSTFLQDKTGNSRFLVLPVIKCNAYHNIDMQQLYAQLYEQCSKNPNYELSEEECKLLTENNRQFEGVSFLEEKFDEIYNINETDESQYTLQTATKVLETLGFQVQNIKSHRINMAKILDAKGYKRSKNNSRRGWYLPPAINDRGEFF